MSISEIFFKLAVSSGAAVVVFIFFSAAPRQKSAIDWLVCSSVSLTMIFLVAGMWSCD